MFTGEPAKPLPAPVVASSVLLKVPYEFQLDNGPEGFRECFSSSCAMVAEFYGKVGSDKEYNAVRARFGDSTSAEAQVRALRALGLTAVHRTNGDAATLERLLRQGVPVPVGWLHKGPATSPEGGGHWTVAIGFDAEAFTHHDPNGEADMVHGGYVAHTPEAGRGIRYSRANWLRRWQPGGSGGWYLEVRP